MAAFKLISTIISVILLSNTLDLVQCKRLYKPDVQITVTLHKLIATWEEAKASCESEGRLLASPVDAPYYKYLKMFIDRSKHSTEYFIGTRVQYGDEPEYISLDGVKLDDMPDSVINMIEHLDPLEGECLAMSRDHIRAVPCSERLPYLCFKNETTAALAKCVEYDYEYSEETGSCYKIYRGHDKWSEANETCTRDGGYLLILNNEFEAKTVVKMFSKEGRMGASWVGIRDDTGRSQWRSVQGHTMDQIYNRWHKYGTNYYVNEACVLLNGDGELFDYFCNYYYHFICEKNFEK